MIDKVLSSYAACLVFGGWLGTIVGGTLAAFVTNANRDMPAAELFHVAVTFGAVLIGGGLTTGAFVGAALCAIYRTLR